MGARVSIAALAATAALCAFATAPAGAQESVALHASFSPERLGASTTIAFGFDISAVEGGLPAPLRSVSLSLPAGLNYLSSELGLAICRPAALLAHGIEGCPPNSRLGFGSAWVEVPFGQDSGQEIPHIDAVMGPPHNGNVVVLFYADGREPVYAQIVFAGELISGTQLFGGSLNATVPLIPSVTAGPPVSIVRVRSTIGPAHLTYYEHRRGHTIAFHPLGVSLPPHCPHGGFKFTGHFAFQDGTSQIATSTVPCPRHR